MYKIIYFDFNIITILIKKEALGSQYLATLYLGVVVLTKYSKICHNNNSKMEGPWGQSIKHL
jgi:hypothetical protein